MNPPSQKQIRTVALASLLGATIEWYDFFLYGVVAGIVFNKLYFPTDDPFIGTLLAYSTFAIGYLARPFGAFVFGHFGDKIGRKSMLVLTMLISSKMIRIWFRRVNTGIRLWQPTSFHEEKILKKSKLSNALTTAAKFPFSTGR